MVDCRKGLSILLVVLSCHVILSESSTRDDLNTLDEYLHSAYPTSDFEENFKIIENLYDAELKKSNFFNKSFRETLRQVISLKINTCDKENFAALLKINDALGGEAHLKRHVPLHRIDSVVWYLSTQHAKECQDVYPVNYEAKASNLNQESVNYVKTFTDTIFKNQNKITFEDVTSMQELFKRFLYLRNSGVVWKDQGKTIYNIVLTNANGNMDAKFLENVVGTLKGRGAPALFKSYSKVRDLYNKYLVAPCRYYVNSLGPEVIEPAIYDSILYHVVDESKRDFYQAWYRFNLCRNLLTNENRILVKLLEVVDETKTLKLLGSIPTWDEVMSVNNPV